MIKLKDKKNYKFRPSLIKKARCGMCLNTIRQYHGCESLAVKCIKGHELKYPLINKVHNCEDYFYFPCPITPIPQDKIHLGQFGSSNKFPECDLCANNLEGYCDGIDWFPFKTEPLCEFFRDKKLICKYAVPYFQYSNHIRNNYCRLKPSKRDGDMKRGWEWNCPLAHTKYAEHYTCYKKNKMRGMTPVG